MLYHIIMPYPFYWDFFGSTGQFLDCPRRKDYKALSSIVWMKCFLFFFVWEYDFSHFLPKLKNLKKRFEYSYWQTDISLLFWKRFHMGGNLLRSTVYFSHTRQSNTHITKDNSISRRVQSEKWFGQNPHSYYCVPVFLFCLKKMFVTQKFLNSEFQKFEVSSASARPKRGEHERKKISQILRSE